MRPEGGLLLPFGVKVDRHWYTLMFDDGSFDEFLGEIREYGRDISWMTADHRIEFRAMVAREGNGTLSFTTDAAGLHWLADIVEAGDDPGPTQAQVDLLASIDQKLGLCVSAGVLMHDIEWHNLDEDDEYAAVTRASLYEMSSVPLPAFLEATVRTSFGMVDAGEGTSIMAVMEFATLDEDGKRVPFDFKASRDAALEAAKPAPEPVRTEQSVAELRERLGAT